MSAIPAIRRALVEGLRTVPSLTDVQVTYGWTKQYEERAIVIDAPDPTDTTWVGIDGQHSREERFTIPVRVQVNDRGLTAEEADAALDELLDAVLHWIEDAGTFDRQLFVRPLPVRGEWMNWPGDNEGFIAQGNILLRCKTRY